MGFLQARYLRHPPLTLASLKAEKTPFKYTKLVYT